MKTLIFFVLLIPKMLLAASYYVSSSGGNDANSGLSPDAPWQSLTNVWYHGFGSGIFQPGDSILLKAGDTFDGPLDVHQSGSDGSPITIDRYGTGPNPVIFGDHHSAVWSAVPGHSGVYSSFIGPAGLTSINSIYDVSGNGYAESVQGNQALDDWLNTFGPYTWGGSSIVYLKTPDGNPPPQMRVFELNAVGPNSANYLTIQNLEVCNSYIGIEPALCSHLLVYSNYVHDTLNAGIYFANCNNSTMASNTVNRTGNDSLYLATGENNWIHHNVCSYSGGSNATDFYILNVHVPGGDKAGLGLQQGVSNLVERNSFSFVPTGGLDYYYEVGTEARFNYFFHCGTGIATHGTGLSVHHNILNIDGAGTGLICSEAYDASLSPINNTAPQFIYNNVVFNPIAYALRSDSGPLPTGTSTNVVIRNNIVVTSTINTDLAELYSGVDCDYNLYFCIAGTPRGWLWNNLNQSSLGALRAASGQETHSIYASPQFVSSSPVSASDFQLQTNSPAIDAGQSDGAPVDYNGTPIPQGLGPDIGPFESLVTNTPPPLPPAPPTNLHIISGSSTSAMLGLSYDFSGNPDVTNLVFFRGVTSGVYTQQLSTGLSTSLNETGLQKRHTYYFSSKAQGTNGESGYSNEVQYTAPVHQANVRQLHVW